MAIAKNNKESLDERFTRLIANTDNVPPDKVTVQYIQDQREKLYYGDTRYNISSSYGGHNPIGLTSLTRNESDKIGEIIDEIMQEI